jgi:2-dehydro-3-deoxygalactonokinase
MADQIALVAIDWGTTNRRGWAFAADGRVIDEHADGAGLLAVPKGGFLQSFTEMTCRWRGGNERIPVVMCGMVGSKLGWVEAPYLRLPIDVGEFSRALVQVPGVDAVWIVPGACDERGEEPDVMRGEECQILGALAKRNVSDAIIVLPGTHSKWAAVEKGRLTRFRTYMTGELFSLLSGSGTIAQLMQPGEHDSDAFDRGVRRSRAESPDLLHTLFGVRTLGLFERMPRGSLASYLSGLLIGAEIASALNWAGTPRRMMAIGSSQLLARYDAAARQFGLIFDMTESGALLPPALFAIAQRAGLIGQ